MLNEKRKADLSELTVVSLLITLAMLIPMFGILTKLRIEFGPFSATFLSHLPLMIAVFISPFAALCTAFGSVFGFLLSGCEIWVVARAASHAVFGVVGAVMVKKRYGLVSVFFATLLLHSIGEAVVVLPFCRLMLNSTLNSPHVVFGITSAGTALHHAADFAVTVVVVKALEKSKIVGHLLSAVVKNA